MLDTSTYDAVIVGLGLRGLGVCVQLIDRNPNIKLLVLERQHYGPQHFAARSTTTLADSSFLHDLITQQNPRSEFTYINFLHSQKLLLDFTNVSCFTPSRALTQAYLSWVAEKLEERGYISFGNEATKVQALRGARKIASWELSLRATDSRKTHKIWTKRVVMSTGKEDRLPDSVSEGARSRILALSDCPTSLPRIVTEKSARTIAIVGGSEETVELYTRLYWTYGDLGVTLVYQDHSLIRGTQDTIGQQNFRPNSHYPPQIRRKVTSNICPDIRADTVDKLRTVQYAQNMLGSSCLSHRCQLLAATEVLDIRVDDGQESLSIKARDMHTGDVGVLARQFDYVVMATEPGSLRADRLLACKDFFDGRSLAVDGGYEINLRRKHIDADCGIWVPHALDDASTNGDDLCLVAEVGARIAASVEARTASESSVTSEEVAMM